jgi:hypothetical protein
MTNKETKMDWIWSLESEIKIGKDFVRENQKRGHFEAK